MDECSADLEERNLILDNSDRLKLYSDLVGTLFEVVFLCPPTNAEQYAIQLNLKKQAAKVKESALSSILKHSVPYTVCKDTTDFMFHVEDTVACPLENTSTARFNVYSVVHPTLKDFTWSYGLSPYPLVHVDEDAIHSTIIRKIYERLADFIEDSNYTMYNPGKDWGFWREMFISTNSTEEALVFLYVNVKCKKAITRRKIDILCTQLREHLQNIESRIINLVCLQMVVHWREDQKLETFSILGDGFLYETVGDFNVRMIGRSQFFCNQYGVDTMMKTLMSLADLNHSWVAVNVGSFFGIEALYQSQVCHEVYVICLTQQLMTHIKESISENSVTNVIPTCGKNDSCCLSKQLNDILEIKFQGEKSICLFVNGCLNIDEKDIPVIQSCRNVKKIIWLCDGMSPKIQQEFILLCQEKPEESVEPFVLVKSVSVDASPYSHSVKTMYLFLRTSICMEQLIKNSLYSQANVNKCLHFLRGTTLCNKRKRSDRKQKRRKLAKKYCI